MKTPKQKIIVIYHGGCPDGFGGAYAAWKKFKNKAAYLPATDRFALPYPIKNKTVYLIDWTYGEPLVKKMIKDNVRVTAIDHHKTSEGAIRMTKDYSYSLNHSGATLAWQYFHPGKKMPMFLRYVEDRDLWHWKMPAAKELLMYADTFEQDFVVWDRIVKQVNIPSRRKEYKEKGKLLLRYEQRIIRDILPGAEWVKFEGHTILAINAPTHFVSDLGNVLAMQTGTFALIWREVAGRIKVSLRSERVDSAIDVSKIAKKFNGGGHRSAAAFSYEVGKKAPWKIVKNAQKK